MTAQGSLLIGAGALFVALVWFLVKAIAGHWVAHRIFTAVSKRRRQPEGWTMAEETEWIDWKPTQDWPIPNLPDEAIVVVKYRDGLLSRGRRVDTLRWGDTSAGDDIVAYRVIA